MATPAASKYGRDEDEWDALEDAGLQFLIERARLERVTSYTEMNTVLVERTGFRKFDFDQESERAAMGHLLGRISDREFPRTGVLISAIVNYLNANDAGPGFYKLAQQKGLLSADCREKCNGSSGPVTSATCSRPTGRRPGRTGDRLPGLGRRADPSGVT